jgi:hypothetical protein
VLVAVAEAIGVDAAAVRVSTLLTMNVGTGSIDAGFA